jgi:hypothetical protein
MRCMARYTALLEVRRLVIAGLDGKYTIVIIFNFKAKRREVGDNLLLYRWLKNATLCPSGSHTTELYSRLRDIYALVYIYLSSLLSHLLAFSGFVNQLPPEIIPIIS